MRYDRRLGQAGRAGGEDVERRVASRDTFSLWVVVIISIIIERVEAYRPIRWWLIAAIVNE